VSKDRQVTKETYRYLRSVIYQDSQEMCVKDSGLDSIAGRFASFLLKLKRAAPTFLTEIVKDIQRALARRIANG